MRIDAHQHYWIYNAGRDTWITDEMSVLKRNFLPEHLSAALQGSGFDGTIAVQADPSERETRFLLELAEHNPTILGVVGWIDLRAPDVEERLIKFQQFEKLCGFRHIVQSEPDDRFMLRSEFCRGIKALSRLNFTYDILIYPKQLPAAIELAGTYSEQRFVLDHLAKPEIRVGKIEPWARLVRELAACPNVFCKVSGMITEADWHRWRPADLRPYLDVAFEAFGTSRLVFGSDWPVCLLAGEYAQVVELVSCYMDGFPEEVRAAVFGGNASRCYQLKAMHDESPFGE